VLGEIALKVRQKRVLAHSRADTVLGFTQERAGTYQALMMHPKTRPYPRPTPTKQSARIGNAYG